MTMADLTKAKPAVKKKKHFWSKDDTELSILALPTTIWYILFCYLPMFGIVLAFKKYKIVDATKSFVWNVIHSQWAGFDNFLYFLKQNTFPMILRNTLLYNALFIVLDIVIPVLLAILINNIYSKKMSKTYQTLMFMPHFMSWVVIAYFVYAFLVTDKGLLNSIIKMCGGQPVAWYQSPQYWPFILTFLHVWKTVGYNMVVYLASITGIDTSLYEAAVLDGASKSQQARYITIPSLRPMIIMMFILAVGRIFSSDFGLFYQATRNSGSLTSITQTIDVYVYKALLERPNINLSSAAALMQSVCGCVTIIVANIVVKKIDPESGLF